jgi:paired amphipathic helix protein Sin3a
LNDDWISHPVYVSETGFVSHKKTPYEEAVYKCEEERYEFDLNIEAGLQVISLLEPIAKKLQTMSQEEKNQFKLKPGLGGMLGIFYVLGTCCSLTQSRRLCGYLSKGHSQDL